MTPAPKEPYLRLLAEFVGTFTLCLTISLTPALPIIQGVGSLAPTAIAFALMVSIYALAPISGAHFNPAVSATMLVTGNIDAQMAFSYTAVQLAGGFIGGLVGRVAAGPVVLGPSLGYVWWQAGLCEIFYTAMLCLVVVSVAGTKRRVPGTQFFGLAIGFVIIAGGHSVGHISGGAFNPAVCMVAIANPGHHLGRAFLWTLTYWGFQLTGAAVAAGLFRVMRPREVGDKEEDDLPDFGLKEQCIAELTGTFFLTLTVGLCVTSRVLMTPWAAAAALMSMIYALGDVSGGHFNPAVTVAVICSGRGKIAGGSAGAYCGVQVAAGLLAAMMFTLIQWGYTVPLVPVDPIHQQSWGRIGFAEFVFTFLLCLTVLSVATRDGSLLRNMFGLAIASCVTAGGFAIGAVSGGYLNPAVATGVAMSDLAMRDGAEIGPLFAVVIDELIGGAAAAGAFMAIYPSAYQKSKCDAESAANEQEYGSVPL